MPYTRFTLLRLNLSTVSNSLETQTSIKGLWSDRDKRLHINVLELKGVSLALQRFKDQCQNQTVLVATTQQ